MTLVQRVFTALSDGTVHSGEQLAAAQAVSRSAIWKAVSALEALGVPIEAIPHRGYRLPQPVTPLDAAHIVAKLAPEVRSKLGLGESAWSLVSTNDALLARAEQKDPRVLPASGQFDFLVAEYQTAGRGRRSRPWLAPPGGALCLSLGWSFATLPKGAAALSLAMGVCALRAMRALGVSAVQLKWPNDLLAYDRKLGGILIELRAESAGPAYVVIGMGINCALGTSLTQQVQETGTEPIDLQALGMASCDRNRLAAALIDELVRGVLEFERTGLASFAPEWNAADALVGRVVQVGATTGAFVGHARGIDADGALCVQGLTGTQRFNSGEVTVRSQA